MHLLILAEDIDSAEVNSNRESKFKIECGEILGSGVLN